MNVTLSSIFAVFALLILSFVPVLATDYALNATIWQLAPASQIVNNSLTIPANIPAHSIQFFSVGKLVISDGTNSACAEYSSGLAQLVAPEGNYSAQFVEGGDCSPIGQLIPNGQARQYNLGDFSLGENKTVNFLINPDNSGPAISEQPNQIMIDFIRMLKVVFLIALGAIVIFTASVAQNNWVAPLIVLILGALLYLRIFGVSLW